MSTGSVQPVAGSPSVAENRGSISGPESLDEVSTAVDEVAGDTSDPTSGSALCTDPQPTRRTAPRTGTMRDRITSVRDG